MINVNDILHLPYTPDLTEGGIECACRNLASASNLIGSSIIESMRHNVCWTAVELAFKRSLGEQNIPFQVLSAMPFTHPEQYDVSLGGHRCELNCTFISHREQISMLRKDTSQLLSAPALLPIEQFSSEDHKPDDVHIFTVLWGLTAVTKAELDKAMAAGQPACLIHPLPRAWSCPADWRPLEKLSLKSDCEMPITISLGGQNSGREFCTARLDLPPKKRVEVEQCFHNLAYLQTSRRPEGRIGLHSPSLGYAYIIPPRDWSNIWVYGMDILLMGWLSHEEFRRKAKVLNTGMHTILIERTREKNLFVQMEELFPLRPLYKRIQDWAANTK